MTVEELARQWENHNARSEKTIDAIAMKVGRMEPELAKVAATLEQQVAQRGQEVSVLFELVRKSDERVTRIETTYVQREDHRRDVDEIHGKLEQHDKQINAMQVDAGKLGVKVAGIVSAVVLALELLVKFVGPKIGAG